MMSRSLTFTLFLALICTLLPGVGTAQAAGPYQYFGVNSPYDAQSFTYPNVAANQTQYMQFVLDTGNGASFGWHMTNSPLDGSLGPDDTLRATAPLGWRDFAAQRLSPAELWPPMRAWLAGGER